MSYVHVPHFQPMEHRTLFQLLRVQAKAHPNKEAFVFRDITKHRVPITFQECESRSQSLATGLLHIGLSRGDRVLVMVPSCPEFVLVYLALNRIGAIAIIDEEDCHSTIKNIKNLACVISKTDYQLPLGRQVVQEIRSFLQKQDNFKAVLISPGNEEDLLKENRVYTYDNLLKVAEKNPDSLALLQKAEEKVLMDDPFLVLFTSGSTSAAKPIEYTHHGLVNGTLQDGLFFNRREDSKIFNEMPVDWLPGISHISFTIECGCTTILFPAKLSFKGKHTSTILHIIAEEGCTDWPVSPAMIHDIVSQEDIHGPNLSKLRYLGMGGQPTSLPTLKKLFHLLPNVSVIHIYGATETHMVSKIEINKDNIDTVDLATYVIRPGLEIQLIYEDEQLVPIGSPGEICARGPWVSFPNFDMLNTSNEPARTREQLNSWHHLKDLGCLDSQGRLKIFGRKDNMIKCATDSIQPVLVEEIMSQHPDVEKVCVVGVPDQRLYEKICACIIMKAGKQGNQAAFDKWAEEHFDETSLGLKLKPHYYVFLDSFPVTRTSKLSQRSTRDLAIKMLGLA